MRMANKEELDERYEKALQQAIRLTSVRCSFEGDLREFSDTFYAYHKYQWGLNQEGLSKIKVVCDEIIGSYAKSFREKLKDGASRDRADFLIKALETYKSEEGE